MDPSTANSPVAQPPLDTFTIFQRFPKEIRLSVWERALDPLRKPRIIEFTFQRASSSPGGTRWRTPGQSITWRPTNVDKLQRDDVARAMLATTTESRGVATKFLRAKGEDPEDRLSSIFSSLLVFQSHPLGRLHLSISHDVFFLKNFDELAAHHCQFPWFIQYSLLNHMSKVLVRHADLQTAIVEHYRDRLSRHEPGPYAWRRRHESMLRIIQSIMGISRDPRCYMVLLDDLDDVGSVDDIASRTFNFNRVLDVEPATDTRPPVEQPDSTDRERCLAEKAGLIRTWFDHAELLMDEIPSLAFYEAKDRGKTAGMASWVQPDPRGIPQELRDIWMAYM